MKDVGRVALVLAVYAVLAWFALPLIDGFGRVLFLPPLFNTLVRALLVAGAVVGGAVAWRYPRLGGGADTDGGRSTDDTPREA